MTFHDPARFGRKVREPSLTMLDSAPIPLKGPGLRRLVPKLTDSHRTQGLEGPNVL